jgi:probable O-glycosylation ligase (exosortase A-associated)
MRDLVILGFLLALALCAFKRPFLFTMLYVYVDIVAPQRLSYYLLNSVPVSLIVFGLALAGYLFADKKNDSRFAPRQALLLMLLIYCGYTTLNPAAPQETVLEKWDWVWKALVFAIFLPLTLRTRLRIETLALVMVLSAGTLFITGGIKTLASGGGYGVLVLLVDDNSGLYEGSIVSMAAIAAIPLILWLAKYGTIFKPDWRVKGFAFALVFACLLIPVGTQARTGIVCIAVLGVLMLRFNKNRFLYAGMAGMLALAVIPFLPSSFTERADTIKNYQADESASTRIAVWKWTWDYAKANPFGGGFNVYVLNSFKYELKDDPKRIKEDWEFEWEEENGPRMVEDKGRAFHSSYFEMLGEQGFPGLILWLALHISGIWRMERLRRIYNMSEKEEEQWIAPFAIALLNAQIIYMVGALFVGIAFQPFMYMLVGMQIGLDTYVRRRSLEAKWRPIVANLHEKPKATPRPVQRRLSH